MLKDQTVLVTGGGGFLGKAVVQKLIDKGFSKEKIKAPSRQECDLRNPEDCRRMVSGIDIVVHLAAVTGGLALHRREPGRVLYENTLMNLHVLFTAHEAGVKKFVGIGTAAAYPKNVSLPSREESLWQGFDPGALHASYNFSKLALLLQGLVYRREDGFNAIHLIATNMYGPRDDGKTGYVIPTLIQRIREAQRAGVKEIEVWGGPNDTRDFLYVDDAADAIVTATLGYDGVDPVNIASGKEVSIGALAELLCRLTGFDGSLRWENNDVIGSRRLLDTQRARAYFGWSSTTSLEEGLQKTIAWFDAQV